MVDLRTYVNELPDNSNILTIQPGGNYGDRLIYMGFKKMIRETKINFTPLKDEEVRNDTPIDIFQPNQNALMGMYSQGRFLKHRLMTDYDAVYIHGGGNFSEVAARYKQNPIPLNLSPRIGAGIKCFKLVTKLFECPVIVGPQSCAFDRIDPSGLFDDVSNNVAFYCREEHSYELMADAVTRHDNVRVNLAEDTALQLTPDDLPTSEIAEEYTLLAFRNDEESVLPQIDPEFETPVVSRDVSRSEPNFKEFVARVAEADTIHTDRLHIAILS